MAGVNKYPAVTLNSVKVKGNLHVLLSYFRLNLSLMIFATLLLNLLYLVRSILTVTNMNQLFL